MNDILFTVIIPTYNRADLILETLQTVWDQSYTNYEVIVIDDCSKDNTAEVLAPYVAPGKIKYVKLETNSERSFARNKGFELANGDYVTLLDSDDFMYPDCLKDSAEYIKTHPERNDIFQNLYEFVNGKRELIYSPSFPKLDNQYKALSNGNFISCQGIFLSRKVYKKFRFTLDPVMITSEDYEIWFRVLAEYQIGRINKVNWGVREHPQRSINVTLFGNLEYHKQYILNLIKTDPKVRAVFYPYRRRVESSFLFMQASVARKKGERLKAFMYMFKIILKAPVLLTEDRFYRVLYNIIK